MNVHATRRWGAALLGVVTVSTLLGGGAASAVSGATPVPDGVHAFTAKITFGDLRACTGALVDPSFVVTAKSCLTDGSTPAAAGAPARPTTVLVGRTDLTSTAGHERAAVAVLPHPDRNLALLRLADPITGVAPVALATTAPTASETLTIAGYGRTATEWVPDRLHAADFTVQGVDAATADVTGASAGATLCRGDAGGPAFRTVGGAPQLAAIGNTSWQKGCLGETETRDGATVTRVDDLGAWIREQTADVQIFGLTAAGQLTYGAIDAANGELRANRVSAATLGFTPTAMATLNADTILVIDSGGRLRRVDVTGVDPLTFDVVSVDPGWSPFVNMTYDGYGSLYYVDSRDGELIRRTVTTAKPASRDDLTRPVTVANSGFTQVSLTSPAAGRVLGQVATGELTSYRINGAAVAGESFSRSSLAATGWAGYTHVLSPGGGWYFARTSTGGLDRFRDANPVDGSGADLTKFSTPVSTSGWNQVLLSARPWTGVVSVFGARPDGRISYTALDPVTGQKVASTVSRATLGFTPKALATLNSDTLLVTDGAALHRVDVTGTQPLTFTRTPVTGSSSGWSHDRLVYDGFGTLYGIAGGSILRRYTVTKAKPAVAADLVGVAVYNSGSGFNLPTLATAGKDRIIGTTNDSKLAMYKMATGTAPWARSDLAASGWGGFTSMFSPGNGAYYRRDANGVVTGYLDASPYDGSGADLTAYTPTGTASGGWDAILSARPYDSWPDSTRRW
ncbi:S1 family peptidase [Micromonospora sp. WMMD975]|uniref:S1 family peptidase n=1 Tax=Micromonospora sp. WMMD975 TaxID=3016087 RepID=UPI00249A84DE|nr:S1 family peptidase [Micromonospora sp. WMMD975]WFE33926.1 S1 family peptidase [Micromonospora sp. WMMD975]